MSQPLVSCIMPTYGRPDYVAESLAMFLAQDYPNKELVICNDCAGQSFICDIANVRVINCEDRYPSLGDKRNAAMSHAEGELIAIWDDDDIHLPWRLSFSIEMMTRHATPVYFPYEFWAYWGDPALHDNQSVPGWMNHGHMIFRRDLWEAAGGYPSWMVGEDSELTTRMLEILGRPWPRYDLAREDRVYVMRGVSRYHHTSISGGECAPDTTPGAYVLEPRPIADDVLRQVVAELVAARDAG